jgi:NADPH:quinone reductase-like Zn-dependent oxidoreductase
METMRAFVIAEPGGPEKLVLREVPRPTPRQGWVLIRNRAFGLNRSEWFTRRGDSPSVRFPRVLGIECTGEVVDAPGSDLTAGERVVAMMGGMGRQYDGSYAEFVQVPREHVFALRTRLSWRVLGALPEMLQTTHGSLHTGLEIERARNILVRGGTSSIGFMAITLARSAGLEVSATTRSAGKAEELSAAGARHVLIDDGSIAEQARAIYAQGFDRVLELIGASTLLDSLRATRRGGIVCMTGILGGQWVLPEFHPMGDVPTGVKLTSYSGESGDIGATRLQEYIELVESGALEVKLGPVFPFERLPEAHRLMDENRANGKIVVEVV